MCTGSLETPTFSLQVLHTGLWHSQGAALCHWEGSLGPEVQILIIKACKVLRCFPVELSHQKHASYSQDNLNNLVSIHFIMNHKVILMSTGKGGKFLFKIAKRNY